MFNMQLCSSLMVLSGNQNLEHCSGKLVSFWRPLTGAPPLDPAEGLPPPDPLLFAPPEQISSYATAHVADN